MEITGGCVEARAAFASDLPNLIWSASLALCKHCGNSLQEDIAAEGLRNVSAETGLQGMIPIKLGVGRKSHAGYGTSALVCFQFPENLPAIQPGHG